MDKGLLYWPNHSWILCCPNKKMKRGSKINPKIQEKLALKLFYLEI
jgi:hypothetical protein